MAFHSENSNVNVKLLKYINVSIKTCPIIKICKTIKPGLYTFTQLFVNFIDPVLKCPKIKVAKPECSFGSLFFRPSVAITNIDKNIYLEELNTTGWPNGSLIMNQYVLSLYFFLRAHILSMRSKKSFNLIDMIQHDLMCHYFSIVKML